jgi:hypothetical protein
MKTPPDIDRLSVHLMSRFRSLLSHFTAQIDPDDPNAVHAGDPDDCGHEPTGLFDVENECALGEGKPETEFGIRSPRQRTQREFKDDKDLVIQSFNTLNPSVLEPQGIRNLVDIANSFIPNGAPYTHYSEAYLGTTWTITDFKNDEFGTPHMVAKDQSGEEYRFPSFHSVFRSILEAIGDSKYDMKTSSVVQAPPPSQRRRVTGWESVQFNPPGAPIPKLPSEEQIEFNPPEESVAGPSPLIKTASQTEKSARWEKEQFNRPSWSGGLGSLSTDFVDVRISKSSYENISRRMFGWIVSPDEIASFCGIIPDVLPDLFAGAKASINPLGDDAIQVVFRNDKVEVNRDLRIQPSGKKTAYSNYNRVRGDLQNQKFGLRMFAYQIKSLKSFGFEYLSNFGERAEHSSAAVAYNGYYTWPRMGYDADIAHYIPDDQKYEVRNIVGRHDISTLRVSELMETRRGRDWWKEFGHASSFRFDLDDDSTSLDVLTKYLQETGYADEVSRYRRVPDLDQVSLSLLSHLEEFLHASVSRTPGPAQRATRRRSAHSQSRRRSNSRPDLG